VQTVLDGAEAQAVEALEQKVTDWTAGGKTDKEFGGDQYDENVAIAIKGLEAVAGDEVKTILSQTGLGSHPEVIRMFLKIGKVFGDPSIITSHGGVAERKDAADILYGKRT